MATAVLASGEGTILAAILDASIPVDVVIADRPCRAATISESRGTDVVLIDRAEFGGFGADFDREGYTEAVVYELGLRGIELVCMAGFGTILSASFFESYGGYVLNTHPALLPAFRGWHAVRDALAAGATTTGCTVHLATEQLDDGPILRQVVVDIEPNDDEASLHERIKVAERALYPETIRAVLDVIASGHAPVTLALTAPGAER